MRQKDVGSNPLFLLSFTICKSRACSESCCLSTACLREGACCTHRAPNRQSQGGSRLRVPPGLPASPRLPTLTGKTQSANGTFERGWQVVKCCRHVRCRRYYRWDLGLTPEMTLASSNAKCSTSVSSGLCVTAEHSATEGHRALSWAEHSQ